MRGVCALALLAACGGRAKVASCDDDLSGSWRGETGTWMLLDGGETLEGYPIFADVPAPNAAPRLIDLRRLPQAMVGEVHRRWMQGALACEGKSQLHVISCRDDRLELVLGDPMAPAAFAPCTWAGNASTHREVWTKE